MSKWLSIFFRSILSTFKTRRDLAFENLLLRQQVAVYKQSTSRPRLSEADRSFWALVSRLWAGWRDVVHFVSPETVVRWHREGFRRHWTRKCRKQGRPRIDKKIRLLIRQMCLANPLWGAPRIHGELLKLGIEVSESVVSKYMIRGPRPPSQGWRTFLENHVEEIIAADFFTVPTATFRVLFVFIVLSHDRREIIHTNVTDAPTEAWAARQILEATGLDRSHRFLVRDRDVKFGSYFSRQVTSAGVCEVVTSAASPWQNAYAERVIGTIRRECLDHIIVLGERHLRRTVKRYAGYYNKARTHLSLEKDSPKGRLIHFPEQGSVRSRQHCGGLHHEYFRQTA